MLHQARAERTEVGTDLSPENLRFMRRLRKAVKQQWCSGRKKLSAKVAGGAVAPYREPLEVTTASGLN
ncbi:hypothetical protein E2562_035150 [Oryza meyeriana var. granulata]|uniref:Uncharacterized protein n=1 Tax=Oryza meyeriana var. granulata TaxID=110450 RepID=A0A6G1E6N1_9ORYZ|nr:hypothetical protein E2562_035150 [Oryza meyeriana var. granulata]